MRRTEDFDFGEVVADKMNVDGQSADAEACGQAQCGQSGEVDVDGVDIAQVGFNRRSIRSYFWGCSGCGRREDEVAPCKCRLKIIGNEAAQFLGFEIVGIVVAVRQYISADHDAAFDFAAETLRRGICRTFLPNRRIGRHGVRNVRRRNVKGWY